MAYDYATAWYTPGWTAQNPNVGLVGDLNSNLSMPQPGLKNLPVVGSWYDQHGRPIRGRLTFTPSVQQVFIGNGKMLVLEPFVLILRGGTLPEGFFLLSPDGPVAPVYPPQWSWNVKGRIGPANVNFDIDVPNEDSTIDITSLDAAVMNNNAVRVDGLPLMRDIPLLQGQDYDKSYIWTYPNGMLRDLTGFTGELQIRYADGTDGLALSLTTENGGLSLVYGGQVNIHIAAEQASSLALGAYVYDLELTAPNEGETVRFLEGQVTIDAEVTK